jgi:2-polyprenyl-3-methyl-5-hydroxy-6-metoxy-1,4-benzoquinol methylase
LYCRFCKSKLTDVFVDLGFSPLANSFLKQGDFNNYEKYYPLKVFVCDKCFLVQTGEEIKAEEIFNTEYLYYSSFSKTWLKHAEDYTQNMIRRFGYDSSSFIVEIASNDGYLLQYFQKENIPVLGIEPSNGTADLAIKKGIPTRVEYFGKETAANLSAQNIKADLLIGNNVLAHVPDINNFVEGMRILLAANGIITAEFPHLLQLISRKQFDTIYHEHYFYYSFSAINRIFGKHMLEIFDVEEIPTHGGSLRIYAKHAGNMKYENSARVKELTEKEKSVNMDSKDFYKSFQKQTEAIKISFLEFLLKQKKLNKKVVGYGAAAKGNTLLNYCGIKNDMINYIIDASPFKQGTYLPGSHIPVCSEDVLMQDKPDFIIIFPWNIKEEIMNQLSYIKKWNGRFVVPIPSLEVN